MAVMPLPQPTHPTLRGRLERLWYPYGWCLRCGRVYYAKHAVSEHATYINEKHGMCPLCEGCWSKLAPLERLPYYDRLLESWISDLEEMFAVEDEDGWESLDESIHDYESLRPKVRLAVLAGH